MPMSDAPCCDTLPLLTDHVRYLFSTKKICRAQNFGVMGFMHLLTQMNDYHPIHVDVLTYACWPPQLIFFYIRRHSIYPYGLHIIHMEQRPTSEGHHMNHTCHREEWRQRSLLHL